MSGAGQGNMAQGFSSMANSSGNSKYLESLNGNGGNQSYIPSVGRF